LVRDISGEKKTQYIVVSLDINGFCYTKCCNGKRFVVYYEMTGTRDNMEVEFHVCKIGMYMRKRGIGFAEYGC